MIDTAEVSHRFQLGELEWAWFGLPSFAWCISNEQMLRLLQKPTGRLFETIAATAMSHPQGVVLLNNPMLSNSPTIVQTWPFTDSFAAGQSNYDSYHQRLRLHLRLSVSSAAIWQTMLEHEPRQCWLTAYMPQLR